jgi:hypothetical protein
MADNAILERLSDSWWRFRTAKTGGARSGAMLDLAEKRFG